MNFRRFGLFSLTLVLSLPKAAPQTATPIAASAPTAVPSLVPYSGTANTQGKAEQTTITFQIFKEESSGEPLFTETQSVQIDPTGHYKVHLGATNPNGLPTDLFSTGEARWLEVQIAGQTPQPRILLASVPYALKAQDATTLNGLPASAYALAGSKSTTALAAPAGVTPDGVTNVTTSGGTAGYLPLFTGTSTIADSILYSSSTGLGVGDIPNPTAVFDVNGKSIWRGLLNVSRQGTATATTGYDSYPMLFQASSYNSSTKAAALPEFQLQAEPVDNNTATPAGTFNLLYNPSGGTPTETGLSFNGDGTINFAPTQTFQSTSPAGAAFQGYSAFSPGIEGSSTTSNGVSGTSSTGNGVVGATTGTATPNTAGVYGEAGSGSGIGAGTIAGVWGDSKSHVGVAGTSLNFPGVRGTSKTNNGVYGNSTSSNGVYGVAGTSSGIGSGTIAGVWGDANNHVGVAGTSASFPGVTGSSGTNYGVQGTSYSSAGVQGASTTSVGVQGTSDLANGVQGSSNEGYGVQGTSISTSTGSGVYGVVGSASGFAGSAGVWGDATNIGVQGTSSSGAGVFGESISGYGVWGFSGSSTGVYGLSDSSTGVYGLSATGTAINGVAGNHSNEGGSINFVSGIWVDTGVTGNTASLATADEGYAGLFYNSASPYATIYAENDAAASSTALVFHTMGGTFDGDCKIDVSGNLSCNGSTINVVKIDNGARNVETYSMQSAENWFEDAGAGQLQGGTAHIDLEPVFGQTVNTGVEYHVFLTPDGDCKGLYVSAKSSGGFDVRELGGGKSTIAFEYRIMAKRAGHERTRLTDVTAFTREQSNQREKMRRPASIPTSKTKPSANVAELK